MKKYILYNILQHHDCFNHELVKNCAKFTIIGLYIPRFTDYLSVLPIVRICNCQWNICQYTKCHTIKCHTQRIVIYLKLWLIVSIFIFLNEIQEKLKFIKAIEITNVTHVKSHFLIQGTWTHIDSVHNWQKDYKCNSCVKSFSQAGNMKTHIDSVHNGQKYHKCDTCGKSFSQARNSHKFHIFNLLHYYVSHIFKLFDHYELWKYVSLRPLI